MVQQAVLSDSVGFLCYDTNLCYDNDMKSYNIAEISNIYFSSENCETFEFAPSEILELSIEPTKEKKWETFSGKGKERIPHVRSGILKIKVVGKSKYKLGIDLNYRHYSMEQIAKRLGGFCDICRLIITLKNSIEECFWIPYGEMSEDHDAADECPSARFEDGVLTIKMGELSEITHGMKVEHGIHSKTPLHLIDKVLSGK